MGDEEQANWVWDSYVLRTHAIVDFVYHVSFCDSLYFQLTNYNGVVIFFYMLRKALNVFISALLLLSVSLATVGFSNPLENYAPSFQKSCDMDRCNSNLPKCPLCPSSSSLNAYLPNSYAIYLPTIFPLFNPSIGNSLCDQGVVRVIFRPPISTP